MAHDHWRWWVHEEDMCLRYYESEAPWGGTKTWTWCGKRKKRYPATVVSWTRRIWETDIVAVDDEASETMLLSVPLAEKGKWHWFGRENKAANPTITTAYSLPIRSCFDSIAIERQASGDRTLNRSPETRHLRGMHPTQHCRRDVFLASGAWSCMSTQCAN